MPIDRKKFLMLALSMSFGATGCTQSTPPAVMPANTADDPMSRAAPADECVDWSPTGECVQWAGAAPADECVDWSPTGECTQWVPADEGWGPTDECVDWSPTGECIDWM
jgi:hypothetical protein